MKRFNISILLLGLLVLVGGISIFMLYQLDDSADEKKRIYLVVKTVTENGDFWSNIIKGAELAASELDVEVIIKGPEKESYVQEQIGIIESLIKEKPVAIAIAATDYEKLGPMCDRAIEEGIILVTFDSDALMHNEHSFIATNNQIAAQRLAHELATLMQSRGKVAIFSHMEGTFTSQEREEGFIKGLKPYSDIEIFGEIQYTDNNAQISYDKAVKVIRENSDITAIYGTNEATLTGIARAVSDLELEDEIHVVGFDMSNSIAQLIEENVIDAAMVQRPFNMGYLAINEVLEIEAGKEASVIDTGSVLINKANMYLPENQKLIVPNM
jgi:ribose transport system substrate-binding protein